MISLSYCLKMAIASLKSSKLRSGLTALGIIIGIAAVIATFTLGSSFTGYFTDQLDTQGSNYILIAASKPNLFYDSQLDIVRNTPGVTGVATDNSQTGLVTFANEAKNLTVLGTQEGMIEILSLPIYDGQMYSDKDSYVAVIGKNISQEEFRKEIGLRSTIEITLYNSESKEYVTETFRVVGILGSDETSLITGGSENTLIAIPTHIMQQMTGENAYQQIYAMSDSREDINATTDEIERRLARNLGVSERDLDDDEKIPFMTMNQAELLEQVRTLTNTLQMFLLAIGGISLVVGAVGIMNIMIVTVTERTREIGTLKALGYSSKDVLMLFVIESIIISAIGGLIGTLLGLTIAYIGANILGLPMAIPFSGVLIGVGLSIAVGVLAGAQPSYRAAKMNPVDALRDI
ncbi:ABC transporter permease [Methanimicrococcus blatticola]|uniref:Putative ABC transport system permease protein n=1 Tax=Methanimicrococcus blatticola TaxID=91560 RepID=A0A484F401_9EURY|nr:ABC transporter permease [Methanimicrococcus blatticola]MBZ3935840.1 ABC transporter permease [Methanimicrococcus blatticola]MCC2508040.1 ABC transporter permease [Methanimicrococcus blatticola]TDQ68878.1 putative ABC transport system permease protein [Methanimicrococcus blatticola]